MGSLDILVKLSNTREDKPFYKDPLVYAAAGGVGASAKLTRDLSAVSEKMDKWDRGMTPHAERAASGKMDITSGIKAINEYNRGAEEVSKQRILGIRAGSIMGEGRNILERSIRVRDRLGQRFIKGYSPHIKSNAELEAIHNHYKLYSKTGVTKEKLLSHIIEKGINDLQLSDHDLQEAVKNDPNIKTFVHNLSTSKGDTGNRLLAFKHSNPESYARLKQVISGGTWAPGEAKMLSGNKADFVSVPRIYNENLKPIIRGLKSALPYVAIGGAGYVGYRIGDDIAENMHKKGEDKNTDIIDAAITGAGGAVIYKGIKTKPHKDIAITYGTMPGIGEGHSSPGRAIKKILGADKRFSGVNIDLLERDAHGLFIGPDKKYNTVIDTGLGAYIPSDAFDAVKRTHGENIPVNVSARTRVRYLTDVVHPGGGTSGAIWPAGIGKQPFITYGPYLDRMGGREHVKHINAGHNMSPALDPDAIKEIATTKYDKNKMLDNIIAHIKKSPADIKDVESQIMGLESLRGKKIITISGSGRGDYVYARARQLAKELKRSKLDGEYGILALSAGGKGSPMAKLIQGKDVVDVGRLPKSLFVGAQNISDVHWGSTGTSSMMESIVSGRPQLLQDRWGGNFNVSNIDKGSIADYQERLMRNDPSYKNYPRHIKHVETDAWNKGNRAMMREMPGVAEVGHADDVIGILRDKNKLTALKESSALRQKVNYEGYQAQVKNMADDLHTIYKKNIKRDKMGKLLLIAGGTALAGTGISRLLSKNNTTDRST